MKRGTLTVCATSHLLVAFVVLLSILPSVVAHPPFPTVFYGLVYNRNLGAPVGAGISATYSGGSCDSFSVVNNGTFGVLVCPGDDPETAAKDGASEGENITFRYNSEPVSIISGNTTFTTKSFKFLTISHPIPYCGDTLCDIFFENIINCPFDCNMNVTNPNVTINYTFNETNHTSGTSRGGGGGGGGGGGSMSSLLSEIPPYLSSLFEGMPACEERWTCTAWTDCTPYGLHNRTCEDANNCGTTDSKPTEVEVCEYIPTCFDRIQNGDEGGIDCGGKCKPCPGCNNGIQDPGEEGIDCGGPCRPCNSCENRKQDWTETGIDCGGLYCRPCYQAPIIQLPLPVCRKDINPLNNDAIFFLLLMFLAIAVRVAYGVRELKAVVKEKELDDLGKAKAKYHIRRSIYVFVGVVIALVLLLYFYYYYFYLCEAEPKYLWWMLVLLLLLPFVVFIVIRRFEYNEKEKLRKLERTLDQHRLHLLRLVEIENSSLASLEKELADEVHHLSKDAALFEILNDFPDLGLAYRNMITLYERYRERQNPFEIEKELCDEVYRLETDVKFQRLAQQNPGVMLVYRKLRLLYVHYETKQQLYDQIDFEDEKIDKDIRDLAAGSQETSVEHGEAPPPKQENDEDAGDGFSGSGTKEKK